MNSVEQRVGMMRLAAFSGVYGGLILVPGHEDYIRRCTATMRRPRGGDLVRLIFTRDQGHHTSGWWKNPDFERCLHLSVSYAYADGSPAPYQFKDAAGWSRLFFGDDVRRVWVEPAYTRDGKGREIHHYRLFCDAGWQPITPRGEVYSKQFTEVGWKSFSEIHGAKAAGFVPPMGFTP